MIPEFSWLSVEANFRVDEALLISGFPFLVAEDPGDLPDAEVEEGPEKRPERRFPIVDKKGRKGGSSSKVSTNSPYMEIMLKIVMIFNALHSCKCYAPNYFYV